MKAHSRITALASTAGVCFATATLGDALAFPDTHGAFVLPATGAALALLLLFGAELWPGILLGVLLAHITGGDGAAIAFAIASGVTLEAIIAERLLRRFAGLDRTLDAVRHAIGLILLAATASTIVGATIGVTTLCASGERPWAEFGQSWINWWLGGALGDLIVVPVLLTWHAWREALRRRVREATLLLASLAVVTVAIFTEPVRAAASTYYSLEYIIFPFLIGAAIRFGTAGAAAVNVVASSVAIWATLQGFGPYAAGNVADRLLLVQLFMTVVAATGLMLGATISERSAVLSRRNAEHAVTRVLAEAATAEEATSRIIDVINAELNWDIGLWWSVDAEVRRLRCAEVRCQPGHRFPEFEKISLARTFEPGEWLPGHVWAYAAPQWVSDVLKARDYPRLKTAAGEGLHGTFAFPISVGKTVLGVFEFCSRSVRRPDDDLLWMFNAIGAQVGQFLARKGMEQQVQESEARKAGMLHGALDCVITVDQIGRIVEFNPAAERTFGYRAADLLGHTVVDILIPETYRERFRQQMAQYYASGRDTFTGRRLEVLGMRADGTRFPAELSIIKSASSNGPLFTGFLRDITRQKRRARQLAFRATHDGLTKLLNRSAFMDRLKDAVHHAREVGGSIAILFIDLDQFKGFNDRLGHLVGDRLLVETARRLRRCVRPGDTVARLGGDEFAILLERVIDANDASGMADRIKRDLSRSFAIDDDEIRLSASIGIAINGHDADRPYDLLRTADAAMYRAKATRAGHAGAS
jgi:diguanylate cyclase (GGDEF)-like protein/PAS domain S-box-containing protein